MSRAACRSCDYLPVRHFHVVFTLPSEIRALGKTYPRQIFGALFSAASDTLADLGESRLHARPGVTMVLHTWTRASMITSKAATNDHLKTGHHEVTETGSV